MNNLRTTNRFFHEITLKNFLSFGPQQATVQCNALNVFIGPNASGKSNFLEAIDLLAHCPADLPGFFRAGGGVQEWLWKGASEPCTAALEAVVECPPKRAPLRYRLEFLQTNNRLQIEDESLEAAEFFEEIENIFYEIRNGQPFLHVRETRSRLLSPTKSSSRLPRGTVSLTSKSRLVRPARNLPSGRALVQQDGIDFQQSILSQRKDPIAYPELTSLGQKFSSMRLYREWNLGRKSPPRLPQPADLPEDFLLEDAKNLGLVLNDLQHHSETKNVIVSYLRKFYEQVENYSVKVYGGTVQIYIHEKGAGSPIIPATRLSDGTLRYLCLLAVLCHPTPPPVVCIEEPEIGLHPDMIATVAELLHEASKRTQLFVTTHSDGLVDALTDQPDAVVVCEKGDNGTQLQRLDPEKLKDWLKRYSLGELWMKGEIGGQRW